MIFRTKVLGGGGYTDAKNDSITPLNDEENCQNLQHNCTFLQNGKITANVHNDNYSKKTGATRVNFYAPAHLSKYYKAKHTFNFFVALLTVWLFVFALASFSIIGTIVNTTNRNNYNNINAIGTAVPPTQTDTNTYSISTPEQLLYLSVGENKSTYLANGVTLNLTTDLVMNVDSWTPLKTSNGTSYFTFNGNGHIIDFANKVTFTSDYCGFFGYSICLIVNELGITYSGGAWTTSAGNGCFGGLIANCSNSQLRKCFTTGTLYSQFGGYDVYSYFGGLIGEENGSVIISNCYSGMSFYNGATVSTTSLIYTRNTNDMIVPYGAMLGYESTGGLVGRCYYYSGSTQISITNSYFCGSLSANLCNNSEKSNLGGIVGGWAGYTTTQEPVVTNCFYLKQTDMTYSYTAGTPKTADELKNSSIVTALGSDVWTINANVNNGYPVLSLFYPTKITIVFNVIIENAREYIIYITREDGTITQIPVKNGTEINLELKMNETFDIMVYKSLYMYCTIDGIERTTATFQLSEDKTIEIVINSPESVNNWVFI